MRPVLHEDLVQTARAVLAAPVSARRLRAREIVERAEMAARHFAETGHSHPEFGNGSLADSASEFPRLPERTLSDPEYRRALLLVLSEVDRVLSPRRS